MTEMAPEIHAPSSQDVHDVVHAALAEDLRYGPDVTTAATVAADTVARAEFTPRAAGVLAGIPVLHAVLDAVLPGAYEVCAARRDGDRLVRGEPALVVRGRVRELLTAERTALNLVSQLSGVATATAEWVAAVAGTGCAIRDTRKTVPGLRALQKYAVRCGGGVNHRLGLGDAILIKDNHVAAAGSVVAALRAARAYAPELRCEVEVDTIDQLRQVLEAGADEVLLDNFSPAGCAEAVRLRDAISARTTLEASGGLRLVDAMAFAESGVDYLAVGALTHSASVLDIGLDLH
ncbi:nicotinate-nucleotide pyrophosphorylase [carboxylating] [Tamaricihabitans halophyticus]|uniref:Nicotinate-nucleotide pyrophosphorylase [carboxylating] n=1 Tax=Tamaricihabitans halophyticus TaxID=1262583 RepID=A0A4R2Q967_9PSEU|nr:carboxylating nicotinate-nucleotide diphosphorylase [Tamaricihabitans halophyticus]TCP45453.1 nicotinate-nucleotide pyrophosphorylase [carboxylating] [Tamaricihabitans halophyticus]